MTSIDNRAAADRAAAALVAARLARGESIVGLKLSVTSAAAQQRASADGPIHGWLTDAMRLPDGAHIRVAAQSRGEAEIAFVLGHDVRAPGATAAAVLAAADAVHPAFDLPSPGISGATTLALGLIANNANAGHFVLGDPLAISDLADLRSIPAELVRPDGAVMSATFDLTELAGHVASLANALGTVTAGSVVLTGALTGAFPLRADRTIALSIAGRSSVRLHLGPD